MEGFNFKQKLRSVAFKVGARVLQLTGRDTEAPRLTVIMFHSVGAEAIKSMPRSVFVAQLMELKRLFPVFTTVTEAAGAGEIRDWTACLTFDDGFIDNYSVVVPILQELGLKASFFLCSGFVDGRIDISKKFVNYRGLDPITWEQAREMATAGMEIGCHTVSHPVLARLAPERQDYELVAAKQEIEDRIGRAVTSFAIPFGSWDSYTRTTLDICAKYFQVCCTTRAATNFAIPRRHRNMAIFDRLEPSLTDMPDAIREMALGRQDVQAWLQRTRQLPPHIRNMTYP